MDYPIPPAIMSLTCWFAKDEPTLHLKYESNYDDHNDIDKLNVKNNENDSVVEAINQNQQETIEEIIIDTFSDDIY